MGGLLPTLHFERTLHICGSMCTSPSSCTTSAVAAASITPCRQVHLVGSHQRRAAAQQRPCVPQPQGKGLGQSAGDGRARGVEGPSQCQAVEAAEGRARWSETVVAGLAFTFTSLLPAPRCPCSLQVRLAVFSQHHVDGLDLALSPLQYMAKTFPQVG